MGIGGIGDNRGPSAPSTSTPAPAPRPSAPPPAPEPVRVQDGFSMDRLAEMRERLGTGAPAAPPPNGVNLRTTGGVGRPTATPNSLSVPVEAGATLSGRTPGGYGFSVGVSGAVRTAVNNGTTNGVTTFGVSVDVSATAQGSVSTPIAGASLSRTEGFTASYNLSMPEAVAHTVDPASVNPFDPATMPTGAVATLDGSHYSTTAMGATFRNLAVESRMTNAEGLSVAIARTGPDTVRVTAGPTEAVKAWDAVGVNLGIASARLGRQDTLNGATLRTAEFDLSTPEGAAGYRAFLTEGRLPADNGPGISGVSTTERLDYTSTSSLSGRLGTLSGSLSLGSNTGTAVRTTLPDGTSTRTVDLQYRGNVGLTVGQRFGADGVEDPAGRTYSYGLDLDESSAAMLNAARGETRFQAGMHVDLQLNDAELGELRAATERAVAAGASSLSTLLPAEGGTNEDFAVAMARNLGSDTYGVTSRLLTIADLSDGQIRNAPVPVPGQVIIRP